MGFLTKIRIGSEIFFYLASRKCMCVVGIDKLLPQSFFFTEAQGKAWFP